MMTKWDTIQADIADAYRHLDELEVIDNESLFDEDMISIDEINGDELVLDWESAE